MEPLLQFLLVLTFLPMSTMSTTSNNDYFTLPSNYDKLVPLKAIA